jgi:hypothetical protein
VKKGKEVKVIERGATSGLLVFCLNLTKNERANLRCDVFSIRFATGSKFRSHSCKSGHIAIAVSLWRVFVVGEFEINWNDFPLGASVKGGGGRELEGD